VSSSISTPDPPSANRQIARAAGLVTLAFVISNLMGLVRQILLADAFGTTDAMEAFNAANRVSETLFNLVAGGALGSAFIPTFTGLLARESQRRAWRLASAVANLTLIVLIVAAAAAAVFAPQVVRFVLAPGFSADPAKEALTITLTRIMLPSAVLFGLSGLVMGILNSRQVFFIPALTPSMYQLGLIFGILVLSPRMGIFGLAWGVLIGAALHLILQLPALFKQRGTYSLTLGLDSPEVREVIRLMGPRLIGVAVVQLNFWINVRLASRQPAGSVAAIQYAFALMLMPQAAIAQSIATAALPTFSAQVARRQLEEMRSSLASTLRGVLLLALPASVGLVLLRVPIITLLYQRGEFTAYSTALVAWGLLWYGIGLVSHSMVEILARAFYSLHDTRTPVLIGSLAMALNVGLSYAFSALFRSLGWFPHGGLALANTAATTLEMIGLLYLMSKRLNGLNEKVLLQGTLKAGAASAVMAAALGLWMRTTGGKPVWLTVGPGVLIGLGVYLSGVLLLQVKEIRLVAGAVYRRLVRWKA